MKDGKAYKYALWCVTEQERKVPEYVKKQAESWLYIAEGYDADAYVDEEEYPASGWSIIEWESMGGSDYSNSGALLNVSQWQGKKVTAAINGGRYQGL